MSKKRSLFIQSLTAINECFSYRYTPVIDTSKIRGPCEPMDITIIAKEMFIYDPPNRRKIAV